MHGLFDERARSGFRIRIAARRVHVLPPPGGSLFAAAPRTQGSGAGCLPALA
ncbi:MAG TPA: hypothetical protein G4O08_05510 [Anaerolineae bacterium]|nr:hypothetical protein [Anaerolineae bacterium]